MSGKYRSEREEKLLERIIETDGIKKIQDAITAVISSGSVDVTDRATRLLGQVYGDDAGTPRKLAVDSSGKLRVVTT